MGNGLMRINDMGLFKAYVYLVRAKNGGNTVAQVIENEKNARKKLERNKQIVQWYSQGKTQQEIADEFGMTCANVKYILKYPDGKVPDIRKRRDNRIIDKLIKLGQQQETFIFEDHPPKSASVKTTGAVRWIKTIRSTDELRRAALADLSINQMGIYLANKDFCDKYILGGGEPLKKNGKYSEESAKKRIKAREMAASGVSAIKISDELGVSVGTVYKYLSGTWYCKKIIKNKSWKDVRT